MNFEKIDYSKIPQLAKKMQSCFTANSNINRTAYLNWRISNSWDIGTQFFSLSEGYFESARYLIDECLKDNFDKKADIFIFPILFNVVHGTELALKAINDYLYMILDNESKIEGKHDIKQISDVSLILIKKLKNIDSSSGIVESITAMKLIKNFINNVYEQTNDMAFARYPIDTDDQAMFYAATNKNVVVDLEKLKEQIVYVFEMLDFIMGLLGI